MTKQKEAAELVQGELASNPKSAPTGAPLPNARGLANAPTPAAQAVSAAGAGVASRPAPVVTGAPSPAAPASQVLGSAADAEARADQASDLKGEKQKVAKKTTADRRWDVIPPLCTLIKLEDGRSRLTVVWRGGEHLYVLQRKQGAVAVLAPSRTTPLASGLVESVFVCSREGAVDVYLLHGAITQPEQLPAEGPVEGYRHRLME